jgi:hypothetical protein
MQDNKLPGATNTEPHDRRIALPVFICVAYEFLLFEKAMNIQNLPTELVQSLLVSDWCCLP